jgi:hypothetical protein
MLLTGLWKRFSRPQYVRLQVRMSAGLYAASGRGGFFFTKGVLLSVWQT